MGHYLVLLQFGGNLTLTCDIDPNLTRVRCPHEAKCTCCKLIIAAHQIENKHYTNILIDLFCTLYLHIVTLSKANKSYNLGEKNYKMEMKSFKF